MSSIIQIHKSNTVVDNSIVRKEFQTFNSYTNSFEPSDEIRITIQASENYILPCDSYLLIEVSAEVAAYNQPEGRAANLPEVHQFFHLIVSLIYLATLDMS